MGSRDLQRQRLVNCPCLPGSRLPSCTASALADSGVRAVCRLQARLQHQRRLLCLRPHHRTRVCRGARCTSWRLGQDCSLVAPSLCTSSRWDTGCLDPWRAYGLWLHRESLTVSAGCWLYGAVLVPLRQPALSAIECRSRLRSMQHPGGQCQVDIASKVPRPLQWLVLLTACPKVCWRA